MRQRGVSQNAQSRLSQWPTSQTGAFGQTSVYRQSANFASMNDVYMSNSGSFAARGSASPKRGVAAAPMPRMLTIKETEEAVARLNAENAALKKEVHRLRKIEAGWFPPRDGELTTVNVYNNYEERFNQFVAEINNLRQEVVNLQSENAELCEQLAGPSGQGPLNELQARLAQAQFEQTALSNDLQRMTQNAEAERATAAALREDIERLRATQLNQIREAEENVARELKATIADLRIESRRFSEEIEVHKKTISSLETRLAVATAAAEQAADDSAARDRDRIIERYQQKWEQIKRENTRLRAQLEEKEEAVQAMALKTVVDAAGSHRREQDKVLIDALNIEIGQLQSELATYKRRYKALVATMETREETSFSERDFVAQRAKGGRRIEETAEFESNSVSFAKTSEAVRSQKATETRMKAQIGPTSAYDEANDVAIAPFRAK